jgi:hypothetical protein
LLLISPSGYKFAIKHIRKWVLYATINNGYCACI